MPVMENGEKRLHYEERGTGFPVLTFAPGGMRSGIDWWSRAPWDPVAALAPSHRVITMDQRNTGGSWAPVRADDGWDSFTDDHLALLDHLGVERAHLLGMCIGGSFIANLLNRAPERVGAAVAMQPIGNEDNRDDFRARFDEFAAEERDAHPEAGEGDWRGFRENLWDTDATVWSVADVALATFSRPLLVLMGGDAPHPESASRTLAELVPGATLIERWKEPPHVEAARESVAQFLAVNTPG